MKHLKFLLLILVFCTAASRNDITYKCMPCGESCDKETYDHAGTCKRCDMPLVKTSDITFTSVEPNEICKYIKEHPYTVLLDVRTKEEFDGTDKLKLGTLKNAVNIPFEDLEKKLPMLDQFKHREILVYCSHSHRSPQAAYFLTQNGFEHVVNMSKGMSALKDQSCKK
ncbi:MAG: rhodanese-like domain-containing protein [Flavobacterium sp.]|nr:MAG: rhodanese-like domain-containing protein [Flavobacterium sp.]